MVQSWWVSAPVEGHEGEWGGTSSREEVHCLPGVGVEQWARPGGVATGKERKSEHIVNIGLEGPKGWGRGIQWTIGFQEN